MKRLLPIALCLAALLLCACGAKYPVEYREGIECFTGARPAYRAGARVCLYYPLVATDTDYTFTVTGADVQVSWDDARGYCLRFVMPAQPVQVQVDAHLTMTEVVNPLQEGTWQQMCDELGTAPQLPPTAQEPTVLRYALEPVLYEVAFCPVGGQPCTLRLTPDPDAGDISGMYYDWTTQTEHAAPACTVLLNETGQGVCLWRDDAFAYALTVEEGAAEAALLALCAALQGQ